MIRDVDLVSYFPPFMQNYKEPVAALEAENTELNLVWKEADRVLYNHFISSADEYGISRFEKMLGILPYAEDTLESRRARVQSRWFKTIPYTLKALENRLASLCGDGNYSIEKDFSTYHITLNVSLSLYGQAEELDDILSYMMPQNIVVEVNNTLRYEQDTTLFAVGATVESKVYTVESLTEKEWNISGFIGNSGTVIQTIERTIN